MLTPVKDTASIKDTALDQNSLNSIKAMGRKNDPQAFKEVAKKFEAMFVQQMLKSMCDANAVFSEGNMFSSEEEKFHQDMLDQQMVLNLTSGKGIGLAKVMYEQMQRAYGNKNATDIDQPTVGAFGINQPPELISRAGIKNLSYKKQEQSDKTPEQFMAELTPFAKKAAAELNIKPDVLLAQVALETGWGKNILHDQNGNNSFNIFNIKKGSSWEGKSIGVKSLEYSQGVAEKKQSEFRQYESYWQGFVDYIDLIKTSPRYQKALEAGKDSANYADALQKSGYATDPDYAEKIRGLLSHDTIRTVLNPKKLASQVSEFIRE